MLSLKNRLRTGISAGCGAGFPAGPRKHSLIGVDIGETGVRAAQVAWLAHAGGSCPSDSTGPRAQVRDPELYVVTHSARCERRSTTLTREPQLEARADSAGAQASGPAGTRASVAAHPGTENADDKLASLSVERLQSSAECIERCLAQSTFRGRRAVTALDSPDVEFHALTLPEAVLAEGASDAGNVVRWEVQRLLTDPKKAVEIRHWALPPAHALASSSQPAVAGAIGVAAPSALITHALTACARAGLHCTAVDTGATALCRFGCLLKSWSPDEVWGVLDVGARQTRLVLCVGDVPVLVRTAGSGGLSWTERIAESLQIGTKGAEVHKRDHGIALIGRGVRPTSTDRVGGEGDPGDPPPPVAGLGSILLGCLRRDLTQLASEVKRSYEYVLSMYPPREAGDLVLVGGGAALKNLPEFLGGALGIPVRRASDYVKETSARLRCDALSPALSLDAFALAVGLTIVSGAGR